MSDSHLERKRYQFEPLTPEQERLALTCRRMAHDVVNKDRFCRAAMRSGATCFEDLAQEAFIGVMRATKTFDPSKAKFSTYAHWGAMMFARDYAIRSMRHRPWQLETSSKRNPRDSDTEEFVFAWALGSLADHIFNSITTEDESPDEDEHNRHLVAKAMRLMQPRERKAVRLYAELGTLDAAGKAMGISKERVRQLKTSGIKRVRQHFEQERCREIMSGRAA